MEQKDVSRFMAKVRMSDPSACWEWLGARDSRGYGTFRLGGKTCVASRIALQLKLGRPIACKACACHTCDNPGCVNPSHLFEATHKQNMEDCALKGRTASEKKSISIKEAFRKNPGLHPRGTQTGAARLTEAQVLEARSRLIAGERLVHLAKEYGVSRNTMSAALRGRRWGHVGGPLLDRDPKVKLTAEQVIAIRERFAAGEANKCELAREYGVDVKNIREIVFGRTWAHVGGPIVSPAAR